MAGQAVTASKERATAPYLRCPRCLVWMTLLSSDGEQVPVGSPFDCDRCGAHLVLISEGTAVEA